ncbi:CvpA family protein [Magnetovibrio sp. PR-2]|uniref:CvpA family protein n=1 Tax=Magnetovibrio sp. PR-2 TaxID=3120356 RepID=UPI002FCDE2F4
MHWLDILVIGVLVISGAFAYGRGFVHEVLSIASWVGAVFATMYLTPAVEHFTLQFIQDPFFATLATGAVVFIGTLVILNLVIKRISSDVKASALGPLDRALGFLFGVLRGAIIVCLVWIGYQWMTPEDEQPEWIYETRTMPFVQQGADMLSALAPAQAQDPNAKEPKSGSKQGTKSLFDKAITPVPKAPEKDKSGGYGNKERSEMDRLFELNK